MRRTFFALLLLGFCVLVTAQLALPGVIQQRLQAAVDVRDDVRGKVDDISLCLPCASYTLSGVAFEVRSANGWRPLLEARAVKVALLPGSLLAGAPAGAVRLDSPFIGVRANGSEDTALGLPRAAIGQALLPVPIDRVRADGGRVELENPRLDPPVYWRISGVALSGTNLTRRGGTPAEIGAHGRVASDGRIRMHLELPPRGDRFTLRGSLQVPAVELNDYLRNAVALDVAAGSVDADLALERAADGEVSGFLVSRVRGLDVVEVGEISEGRPLNLLWQSLAGGALASPGDRLLELEFEIAESLEPRLDAWSVLGVVVSRSVLTLLGSPAAVVRWLSERLVPWEPD